MRNLFLVAAQPRGAAAKRTGRESAAVKQVTAYRRRRIGAATRGKRISQLRLRAELYAIVERQAERWEASINATVNYMLEIAAVGLQRNPQLAGLVRGGEGPGAAAGGGVGGVAQAEKKVTRRSALGVTLWCASIAVLRRQHRRRNAEELVEAQGCTS